MCTSTWFGDGHSCQRFQPAWRDLYAALKAGIPRAADIATALDARGLTYPTWPRFDDADAEIRCYGVIHRAWRGGLLPEFLDVLCLWRRPGTSLCGQARRLEFQTALLEFLLAHRRKGWPTIRACFNHPHAQRAICESGAVSIVDLGRQLDRIWLECHARCAA